MKKSQKIALKIDNALMIIVRYSALLVLLICAYIVFDTFHTANNAFVSYDLLKYKPAEDARGTFNGFDKLLLLNKDSVGWLTVYDTNIDYPVLRGRDNFEYANKDIYGDSSLTGAIYLDSEGDFKDFSSIIYGHHMENGAMFGDIDKYVSDDFLAKHHDGFLRTPDGNYRLTIFAAISTDAYEDMIYRYNDSNENRKELAEFIRKHAICTYGDYLDKELSGLNKLVMLSTCESGDTFGRMVLLCDAVPGTGRIEKEEEVPLLTALGHLTESSHWAFLNLICMITIIFLVIDSIRKKVLLTFIIEGVTLLVSFIIFIFTENVTKPVVMYDKFTPLMLLILVAAFVYEVIAIKRADKIKDETSSEDSQNRK